MLIYRLPRAACALSQESVYELLMDAAKKNDFQIVRASATSKGSPAESERRTGSVSGHRAGDESARTEKPTLPSHLRSKVEAKVARAARAH